MCPGDNRYEITSPLFDKITITLDSRYYSGKEFVVKTHNNSEENIYIQRATLNDTPINKCWLDFKEISKGGKLELWMGSQPNKNWGTEKTPILPSEKKLIF